MIHPIGRLEKPLLGLVAGGRRLPPSITEGWLGELRTSARHSNSIPLLPLGVDAFEFGLRLEANAAHPDDVLRDLGEALLALVHDELGPELEVLVDQLERGHIALGQLDALPQVLGRVRALCCLHAEVEGSLFLEDSRVLAVGQRARALVAQARDVVLVAAHRLRQRLRLEGAVVVVDHLPDHLLCVAIVQGRRAGA
jgi:hypothetical protein